MAALLMALVLVFFGDMQSHENSDTMRRKIVVAKCCRLDNRRPLLPYNCLCQTDFVF